MTLEVGATASGFELEDLNGQKHSLPESGSGALVLLVFFKTTCSTCDLAFPYINRLWASYRDGWRLWAVAQDPPERASEYARQYGIEYPVLPDTADYAVSKRYDPPATPTYFLIDRDGRVIFTSHGFSKDDLNEISRLIAHGLGVEAQEVAPPDDGQPSFKPG